MEPFNRRERQRRVAPDHLILPLGDEHRAQDRADRAVAVAQAVFDGPLTEFFDRVVGEWTFEQGVVMFDSFRSHCHYYWRDIPPHSPAGETRNGKRRRRDDAWSPSARSLYYRSRDANGSFLIGNRKGPE